VVERQRELEIQSLGQNLVISYQHSISGQVRGGKNDRNEGLVGIHGLLARIHHIVPVYSRGCDGFDRHSLLTQIHFSPQIINVDRKRQEPKKGATQIVK